MLYSHICFCKIICCLHIGDIRTSVTTAIAPSFKRNKKGSKENCPLILFRIYYILSTDCCIRWEYKLPPNTKALPKACGLEYTAYEEHEYFRFFL